MALTLLVAAVLTQQLIRVEYRQDLDRLLKQELAEVRLGCPPRSKRPRAPTVWPTRRRSTCGTALPGVNPGSDRHLTVVQIGGREFSTRDGPPRRW